MIKIIAWGILGFSLGVLIGLIGATALGLLVDGVRWALGEIGVVEQVHPLSISTTLARIRLGKLRLIFSLVVCF